MSLLARLFVLVTLAMLPAIAIQANNEFGLRRSEWAKAQEGNRSYARLLADEQARVVDAAQQLLIALSQQPSVQHLDSAQCHEQFARLQAKFPQYAVIDAMDVSGQGRCAGPPGQRYNVADRAWFRRAIEQDGLAMGDYVLGRQTKRPSLHFAYPIHNAEGHVVGVVAAALDVDWLNRHLAEKARPPGTSYFMVDGRGVVVVGPRQWVGRPLPAQLAPLVARRQPATVELVGLRGQPELISSAPPPGDGPGLFVAVGLDRDKALADLNAATERGFAYILGGFALALLSCWLASRTLVLRPLRALGDTIRAWEAGDRAARTGIAARGELGALARAFDRMAEAVGRADRDRATLLVSLAERERQLRRLADSIPQLVWMARPDGRVAWYNQRWRDYTGVIADGAEPQEWLGLVHPDHAERVGRNLRHSLTTGQPWEDTFPLRARDGTCRWFLSRALPVRDDQGRVSLWFGTNTDVTDQRAAEAALQAGKEAAEEASLGKSKFLAAASHDLRQPMQSLFLFAAALSGQVTDERAAHTLSIMQRSLDTLKRLLDALLDMSRFDAGKIIPQLRDVPLSEVLDEIAEAYAPVAASKGLAFHLDRAAGSGEAAGRPPPMLRSDPMLLGRLIRNLVENALRYTPSGSITLAWRPAGELVWVEVRDTGIGIPADQQRRIFDEFHQLGNPRRDPDSGLGLGLAIVKRIAQLLALPLEVESAPGRGSTFRVGLTPLGRMPAADEGRRAGAAAHPDGAGRCALVIEDDPMVAAGLEMLLAEWGFAVRVAASPAEALACGVAAPPPDLLLADYQLGEGGSGLEVVEAMRRRFRRRVPAVLLTGDTADRLSGEARASGVGLLQKPVGPQELGDLVAAQLAQSAAPPGTAVRRECSSPEA